MDDGGFHGQRNSPFREIDREIDRDFGMDPKFRTRFLINQQLMKTARIDATEAPYLIYH